MKTVVYFLLLLIMSISESYAQTADGVSVASNGVTLIKRTFDKEAIHIRITTHEVNIGKASDGWPEKPGNSCTYSRYPCSLVDDIEISVNEKNVHVARSVFSNLSDLNRASISKVKQSFLLVVEGGDASEGYITNIEFDRKQVKRQTFSSGLFPDKILEEVKFYSY